MPNTTASPDEIARYDAPFPDQSTADQSNSSGYDSRLGITGGSTWMQIHLVNVLALGLAALPRSSQAAAKMINAIHKRCCLPRVNSACQAAHPKSQMLATSIIAGGSPRAGFVATQHKMAA